MNVFAFTKGAGDVVNQFTPDLQIGEIITSISIGAPTPADSGAPTLTISSGTMVPVMFTITGGTTGVTYGFPLTVQTSLRRFVNTVAINVLSDAFAPYPNADPWSYQDMVGNIQAGKTALARTAISFPPTFDPSGGFVTWDILDEEGTIYASGNAFEMVIKASGVMNTVIAQSLINIPADIPQSPNAPYQLRYTLNVNSALFFQFEAIQVEGLIDIQIGAADQIEMQGDPATLSLVTDKFYKNYVLELRRDGQTLASMTATQAPERVQAGYYVAAVLDTSQLPTSCEPYQVVWKFWNNPNQIFREPSALWIVSDSMIQAVEDVKSKINKARQTLFGTPDSQYPSTEVMKWLRRGMDAFNGAYGQFTSFTMTNAKGAVREFWLLCAEKSALEAQYLLEGEKSFNFSGANISLDVDKTASLDSAISKIQSQLDNELKSLKVNLIIKGNTGGDGSGPNRDGNFSALQRGAMGSVHLTLSQASLYGGFWGLGGFGYSGSIL
jgi:hypothetical protein